MKNFFKKLAFVLALAMVVTAIAPAGKASAATAPTLKKSGKVLYIGGDKTGTIGDTYRFTFNNAAGYTATWKSTNKAVATVGAKTGTIQAVAVGTTSIKATLTNKAGKAVELTAKVWVKQNADKLVLGSKASVKDPLAVGDTAKVNVGRVVGTTTIWKQTDKTLSTDYIKWTTSDPAVATVSSWGTVTAVAAGKATITATAYQTEGTTPVDTASFEVTVQAGLTAVAQKSVNTIEATFASDLSAVATKDNVKVFTMVGSTKVAVLVKSVVFDGTDKTKAIVTTYTDIVKGQDYVVEYADTVAKLVGADLSTVATLTITPPTVVKGVPTKVVVKAYTAEGVLIPAANVDAKITLSADASTKYYLDGTNKEITIYNTGDAATVKATYHTYTYNTDFTEKTIEATAVITGADAVPTTIKSVDAFTVYTGTVDYTKPNTNLSVSDTNGSYLVAVKTTDNSGNEVTSSTAGNLGTTKFTFTSSDETTLLVSGNVLYPLKAGSATVIVKYNGATIGAYAVTIGAARAASDVTTTLSDTKLAKGSAADTITLKVVTKDQYGTTRTGVDSVSVAYVTGPVASASFTGSSVATAGDAYHTVFTFAGSSFTTAGTYQFKVTVGSQVRYISFTVDAAGSSVGYYQLVSNTGSTAVDTALTVGSTATANKDFSISLASYSSNGYKIANDTIETSLAVASGNAIVTTGTAFYFAEISVPSGYTAAGLTDYISVTGGKVVVTPINTTTPAAIEKMPVGTYSVKVLKAYSTDGVNVTITPIIANNVVVSDTQTVAVVTINKTLSAYSTLAAALADNTDILKLTIGGTDYTTSIQAASSTTIGNVVSGVNFNLAKVVVKVPVNYGTGTHYLQTVVVNTSVTLK